MENKIINIEDTVKLMKSKFWLIVLITLLTTAVGVFKASRMVPTYTASMKILVGTSDKVLDYYTDEEIEYYNSFMNMFNEIIKIGDFLKDTLKENHIDKTADEIKYNLSFSASSTAPIFTLSYTSTDQDEMGKILDAVCEKFTEEVKEVNPETKVKVLDDVRISSIQPNKLKLILVAFAVGIIVSVGIILFLDYIDDRITKREQLEALLPVPVLGDTPHHEREFIKEARKDVHS